MLAMTRAEKQKGKKVITIKSDEQVLLNAAQLIKDGNKQLAVAKKQVDNAKEAVAKWLKENRNIDIEQLPINEVVNVGGVLLINIGSQNKFDEAAFAMENPELYAEFKRDRATRQFKPLV